MESIVLGHVFEEIAIHVADFGFLYLLSNFLAVTGSFTGLATNFLFEINVSCLKLTAVYYPVECGEADRKQVVLHYVVWGLPLFDQWRYGVVDVNQLTESQIESATALNERFTVSAVSFMCIIDLAIQVTGPVCVTFKVRARVTDMWWFFEPFAY